LLYRIFKLNTSRNFYTVQGGDVEVKGTAEVAAVEWAWRHYKGAEEKLDLMIARFGSNRIIEMRHVVLSRGAPPWRVVSIFEDDEGPD
jgi:hypothetical protein